MSQTDTLFTDREIVLIEALVSRAHADATESCGASRELTALARKLTDLTDPRQERHAANLNVGE